MKITTPEQAEEVFGVEFTNNQYIDILNYLINDVIPAPDGCTGCDRAFVRTMIGQIHTHNAQYE